MKRSKRDLLIAGVMTWLLPGILAALLRSPNDVQLPQQSDGETLPGASESAINVLTNTGVESMPLSEYLTGVLLCEMPESFPIEAQKAQAVVARTYALRMVLQKDKHPDSAICTEPSCCQGYISPIAYSGSQFGIRQARQAVEDTTGQVLLYREELIDATYFSCSGGRTEAAVAVWGTDVPYLQSVPSPGEEAATYYTDTVFFSREEFAELLSVEMPADPASWITGIRYTQGGGIAGVTICGKEFTGTQLRERLGLRSTDISMKAENDGVTIQTKGFGHRVGMSQYGARAMALAGSDYREILMHYYAGVYLGEYVL